jgi:hypothetical protein
MRLPSSFPKTENMTTIIHDMPPAVIIGGAPWWNLRDILKANGYRPFFIRQGLLSLDGLRKFLTRSDKPQARGLLAQVAQRFP